MSQYIGMSCETYIHCLSKSHHCETKKTPSSPVKKKKISLTSSDFKANAAAQVQVSKIDHKLRNSL